MAGLTREGFTPLTYDELVERISSKLEVFSPGIDLSPESPDGLQVHINSFELAQAWSELDFVYNSYNPNIASGAGLRNIGLISGLPIAAASRSTATIDLVGTTGITVPKGSVVSDDLDNEFVTELDAVIPASVKVTATLSGVISVVSGSITTIKSQLSGWTGLTQNNAGTTGTLPQTEIAYRNLRNRTVLRNFVTVEETIKARLLENLGIEQVSIQNNDAPSGGLDLADGTPPQTIHVTVGEVGTITNEEIGAIILATKGLGCPTFGTSSVSVPDIYGELHTVSFSKAVAANILINLDVTYLDENKAGATESIRADLVTHINSLLTDEDVIWSRLFGIITPYAKAQINSLTISKNGGAYAAANVEVLIGEFAATTAGSIVITGGA